MKQAQPFKEKRLRLLYLKMLTTFSTRKVANIDFLCDNEINQVNRSVMTH